MAILSPFSHFYVIKAQTEVIFLLYPTHDGNNIASVSALLKPAN